MPLYLLLFLFNFSCVFQRFFVFFNFPFTVHTWITFPPFVIIVTPLLTTAFLSSRPFQVPVLTGYIVVWTLLYLLQLAVAGLYSPEPWARANYQWLQHSGIQSLPLPSHGEGPLWALLSAWCSLMGCLSLAPLSSWMHITSKTSSPQHPFPCRVSHILRCSHTLRGWDTRAAECWVLRGSLLSALAC